MARDLPRFPGDDPEEFEQRSPEAEPAGDAPDVRPVGDSPDTKPIGDSPEVEPIGDPPEVEPIGDPVPADRPSDDPADLPIVRAADEQEPGPADGPEGADAEPEERSYWTEVPYFIGLITVDRDNKAEEWPEVQDAPSDMPVAAPVEPPDNPDGSWRGDGGQYLPPDHNADADEAVNRVREQEGTVTGELRDEVELNLESGGYLVGLEYRLKGDDRLKEKIAEDLEDRPDRTVSEIVAEIPDAIRYTFQFRTEDYVEGYHEVKERMEDLGYEQVKVKNCWDDTEYKGINTRWTTTDGQLFEVQFHTEESFHAKQEVTHGAYERLRSPLTNKPERDELRAFQRRVCAWVPAPDGVDRIPNYTKEGY